MLILAKARRASLVKDKEKRWMALEISLLVNMELKNVSDNTGGVFFFLLFGCGNGVSHAFLQSDKMPSTFLSPRPAAATSAL